MRDRIIYLMSWPAHLPYLLVSVHTLRQHYNGDIVIYAWPASFPIVDEIRRDKRLGIDRVVLREPTYMGKNDQFLDKIKLAQELKDEVDTVTYLDADTTIHGDLSILSNMARQYGFVATQFSGWVTNGNTIRGRISELRKFPEIDEKLIDQISIETWPSVNGGVWCACPESAVLEQWYQWTMIAKNLFIADEKVLHIMQPMFFPRQMMTTICGNGRYNCSAKFQPSDLPNEKVVVYHYHGDSNVRPQNKSQRGYDLWWPLYVECMKKNIGGIARWRKEVKNKWMDKLETEVMISGNY